MHSLNELARASQTQNIDEAKYEWYQKARIKNVTGSMLQEKAKRASEELGD